MADRPETALDLLWRVVRDVRWRGIFPQHSGGLVSDVFGVYVGFRVYGIEKHSPGQLVVQVAESNVEEFLSAFPSAELIPPHRKSKYPDPLREFKLPIPERGRKDPRGE